MNFSLSGFSLSLVSEQLGFFKAYDGLWRSPLDTVKTRASDVIDTKKPVVLSAEYLIAVKK